MIANPVLRSLLDGQKNVRGTSTTKNSNESIIKIKNKKQKQSINDKKKGKIPQKNKNNSTKKENTRKYNIGRMQRRAGNP